jgi:hypothetical protein
VLNSINSLNPDIGRGGRPVVFDRPVGMVTEFVNAHQSREHSQSEEEEQSEISSRPGHDSRQVMPYVNDSRESQASGDASKESFASSNDIPMLKTTILVDSSRGDSLHETIHDHRVNTNRTRRQSLGQQEEDIEPTVSRGTIRSGYSGDKDAGLGAEENSTHTHSSTDSHEHLGALVLRTEEVARRQAEEISDAAAEKDADISTRDDIQRGKILFGDEARLTQFTSDEKVSVMMRSSTEHIRTNHETHDRLVTTDFQESLSESTTSQRNSITSHSNNARPVPTFPKIDRQYLDIETLAAYELPFEFDEDDPQYLIILREMSYEDTDVLFRHTARARSKAKHRFRSRPRGLMGLPSSIKVASNFTKLCVDPLTQTGKRTHRAGSTRG